MNSAIEDDQAVKKSDRLTRLLGESLAIFAGVVLALAADDWRETRLERAEATASLRLMLEDLTADTATFRRRASTAWGLTQSASWLTAHWNNAGQHPDSMRLALDRFNGGSGGFVRRGAYEGLVGSNGLRLIEGDTLRSAISDYYQNTQPAAEFWWDAALGGFEEIRQGLGRYVTYPGGPEPGRMWPASQGVALRNSWSSVAADTDLQTQLLLYGRNFDFAGGNFERGRDAAVSLLDMIRNVVE